MGESDRQLRRMINSQQAIGQSILLGCLGITAALLSSSDQPMLSFIPLSAAFPVGMGWLKLQLRMNRDARIDKIPNKQ